MGKILSFHLNNKMMCPSNISLLMICALSVSFLVLSAPSDPNPYAATNYADKYSALNYIAKFTPPPLVTPSPPPNQTTTEFSSPLSNLESLSAPGLVNPYSAVSYVQNISAVAV